ncbi:MAG: aldehyde ferredoxin oxidoreductase C-terminal domain-containing protein, partial [Dehalococcoidia bacterium]|nr:aldehyde ferredoxin oxidoreductase C-terminal domain-containing protein [Dehalococcoidia bacterium]
NRLIFMTGPFTGTPVQASSNFEVISFNPLTGCNISVGNSHGFWGARLKFAGFDGVVVQGASKKPVYLWIHDGECEIRDASNIWGKADAFDTEDIIKKELGREKISVAAIGPAGENLCAAAMVQNERGHVAAKGNTGIVMGSKRLKAIAVSGTGKVPVADPSKFSELAIKWREESIGPIMNTIHTSGTATGLERNHNTGSLPVKNLTTSVFPEYKTLTGQYIRKTFELKRDPCYGCSINHCNTVTVTEGPYKGFVGEEPEYEALANLGSNIGISDPGTVTWLSDYVDRLGIDGNWAGAMVGWAMEAYERGILTKEALGGLELRWGDEKAAAELLRRTAHRQGIGDILALGLKKAAEKIGGAKAVAFAVHFKGESNHAYDSRAAGGGQMLHLAIAGAGPRWEGPGVRLDFDLAGELTQIKLMPALKLFQETLGVCMFGYLDVKMDTITEAYQALTGLPMSAETALVTADRIDNLQRAFNVRHGFKPEMDLDVSPRFLEAPVDGPNKGKAMGAKWVGLVKEYNRLKEWDWETGRPSRGKLEQLELAGVADDLWGKAGG